MRWVLYFYSFQTSSSARSLRESELDLMIESEQEAREMIHVYGSGDQSVERRSGFAEFVRVCRLLYCRIVIILCV